MNAREAAGPASILVHNASRQSHFVFGKEGVAGGGESIEMKMIKKPVQRRRRRMSDPPLDHLLQLHNQSDDDGGDWKEEAHMGEEKDEAFVVHAVETHHTLRGIALQYRCTVRACVRACAYVKRQLRSTANMHVCFLPPGGANQAK